MKLVERARAAAVETLKRNGYPSLAEVVKHSDMTGPTSIAMEAALAVIGELEEVEVDEVTDSVARWFQWPGGPAYQPTGEHRTIYMAPLTPEPTVEELARAVVKAWDADQSAPIFDAMVALKAKLDKP